MKKHSIYFEIEETTQNKADKLLTSLQRDNQSRRQAKKIGKKSWYMDKYFISLREISFLYENNMNTFKLSWEIISSKIVQNLMEFWWNEELTNSCQLNKKLTMVKYDCRLVMLDIIKQKLSKYCILVNYILKLL